MRLNDCFLLVTHITKTCRLLVYFRCDSSRFNFCTDNSSIVSISNLSHELLIHNHPKVCIANRAILLFLRHFEFNSADYLRISITLIFLSATILAVPPSGNVVCGVVCPKSTPYITGFPLSSGLVFTK